MRSKFASIAVIAFLGAILIVGSFATDNFGISKAYVAWTTIYPNLGAGVACPDLSDCFVIDSPQAPYAEQGLSIDPSLSPNIITILLIIIPTLILLATWSGPTSRKPASPTWQPIEWQPPAWNAQFGKCKYRSVPKLKRHRSYYNQSA